MRTTVETVSCDVCGGTTDNNKPVIVPVEFQTDQTEGRTCKPYISAQKLDLCDSCIEKIVVLKGWGAQGYNEYRIKGEGTE